MHARAIDEMQYLLIHATTKLMCLSAFNLKEILKNIFHHHQLLNFNSLKFHTAINTAFKCM